MNTPENPYSSPPLSMPEIKEIKPSPSSKRIIPAGRGLRLVNYLVDGILLAVFQVALWFGIIAVGGKAGIIFLESSTGRFIGIPPMLAYYIFCEAATGITFGKLFTGTRVLNKKGEPPSFGQVLGRTFARLIPLEFISFFGPQGRGWHDSLSGTYVVKENALYAKNHSSVTRQIDFSHLSDPK